MPYCVPDANTKAGMGAYSWQTAAISRPETTYVFLFSDSDRLLGRVRESSGSWKEKVIMPGVDFRAVRAAVPIAQVLELVGFETLERSGGPGTRRMPSAWVIVSKESILSFGEFAQKHVPMLQVRVEGKPVGPLGRHHKRPCMRRQSHSVNSLTSRRPSSNIYTCICMRPTPKARNQRRGTRNLLQSENIGTHR